MTAPPMLAPDEVQISHHALERYNARRSTRPEFAEDGIRRLLRQAARRPVPPLRIIEGHGARRSMLVSGFMLVFNADMTALITLWRHKKPQPKARTTSRQRRRDVTAPEKLAV